MSLFCLADKICDITATIGLLCDKNDQLAEINTALCDKIEELVGDPDAECPPCPEATPLVEEAMEQTAAIKEVTAAVAVKTVAIKQSLARETK